jgi:hypothetical protein
VGEGHGATAENGSVAAVANLLPKYTIKGRKIRRMRKMMKKIVKKE